MDEKSGDGQESRKLQLKAREVRVKEREIESAFAISPYKTRYKNERSCYYVSI
jgi:hypothetical protein